MTRSPSLFLALMVVLILPYLSWAAGTQVEAFLPATCGPQLTMAEKPSIYGRENLYKHIDGEAELYMPYGFERAATVFYARTNAKDSGLVVNLFAMGSLLDAFGIYANYRTPAVERANVGAGGFVEESQLMFYQDRYFVQIMSSGGTESDRSVIEACASSISHNLPVRTGNPPELEFLHVRELVPSTEKYYPEGLLGYGFLGRGLTAELSLPSARAKGIILLADSKDGIERAFEAYARHLRESGVTAEVSGEKGNLCLRAADPLYTGVVLYQSGKYAAGVAGSVESKEADGAARELLGRLPRG